MPWTTADRKASDNDGDDYLYIRHSDIHLSSQSIRQMETSDFFLLCCLRTGLLTLRNTAAKALGDRVGGVAYYSSVKQGALIKLAFRLMILDSLGISQALSSSCCLPKICRREDEGGKKKQSENRTKSQFNTNIINIIWTKIRARPRGLAGIQGIQACRENIRKLYSNTQMGARKLQRPRRERPCSTYKMTS